ncbi:hypothetical protein PF005_g6501 [Phytophthora fragariae]|uniref:Reverse transcriptase Ty1/copia-type domain-containing protein n=1 Tax=Phytophthora fragariae TaxID=53985 RepID=A0A6A3LL08_9STRA|nr:hypothetical protein PF003_g38445 [Phytophthora fragariae]KAE8942998.1 hypothetical protein PF009_g7256 [Phytophthora fragariae]KAE9020191.1 hypothetical protein PF011_g5519 [Phytophthora fragariae]KAE9120444.1 hypothetical protein PF007_g8161 [Phytophthora fragariae]KAE9120989.1 hypothetical protein PF010_g7277 [Phytophthora fragariae]
MSGDRAPELPIKLACYTDADFGGDKLDRKSVSGAVLSVNGMIVGWMCKKQGAVALSTAEAEFVAASCGGQELLGLKELLSELGMALQLPLTLYMDNQAAIKQVQNEASSSRAKHVDVRLKFLQDYAAKEIIEPTYVETGEMIADLFTKALPAPRILKLRAACGLK